MQTQKLKKVLIFLIVFIFIVNFLANKFYWYYSIWYFDMIMHTLGGFWLGIAYVYIFPPKHTSFSSILKIILFVLLIGVGWEVFEILVNNVFAQMPFNTLDTLSDVFFDLTGGTIASLYFMKIIMHYPLPPPHQGGEESLSSF